MIFRKLILFGVVFPISIVIQLDYAYDKSEGQRSLIEKTLFDDVEKALVASDLEKLQLMLTNAVKDNKIDFFILRKDHQTIRYVNLSESLKTVEFAEPDRNSILVSKRFKQLYVVKSPYLVAYGHNRSVYNFMTRYLEINYLQLLIEAVILLTIISLSSRWFSANLAQRSTPS